MGIGQRSEISRVIESPGKTLSTPSGKKLREKKYRGSYTSHTWY